MKKITMQDIADDLNVSRVTVWKVLNGKEGVSFELKEKIIKKAKELGYLKAEMPEEKVEPKQSKKISVLISRPESSVFWINIIHAVAKELDQYDLNLVYTYLPPKYEEGYTLPDILKEDKKIDGILIMNVYDAKLLEMINQLELPKVYLDLVSKFKLEKITGDLILLEGKTAVQKITKHLIENGKKKLGFIGDINYALTNKKRYQGFTTALKNKGLEIENKYCLTKEIGIYSYYTEISNFLDQLETLPDAFVCASDFIANFLMRYFIENGIKVPEDIALSGYDGNNEYSMIAGKLTTVKVETDYLGKRLADQLIYRIKNPNSPIGITNIYSKVLWGDSTKFS
ncbi:substrate-binding domain-containing protein [Halanaerobium praevalens]|uniref:Transcriptional regulator, LacI family n=1 Tax=Halanaerobium praevalens (strain ATCC 33744 / DSM 2228 / GSL) TaxID=572479 RepID=E3DS40_HALPG|nr:substrate-binding domain-containing protein [Halanaerobium praevalens]ADO78188.1 transcriptional regulator, LacI family [Halanaerobium praevalens DSM 2228]